jgi:hypothetical protein
MLRHELKNISSESLFEKRTISMRARNICRNAKLDTLEDILSYYEQGNSFADVMNAGYKTSWQLEQLCIDTISGLTDYQIPEAKPEIAEETNEQKYFLMFDSLKDNQKYFIELMYNELIQQYSIKTQNSLSDISYNEFIEAYLDYPDKKLMDIKGVGKRSFNEIYTLKYQIKNKIEGMPDMSEIELTVIAKKEKYGDYNSDPFFCNYYERNQRLPMLWIFLKKLPEINWEYRILFDMIDVGLEIPRTGTDSANNYSLPSGKARQIAKKIFTKFFSHGFFLFRDRQVWVHYIESLKNEDVIHEYDVNRFIEDENVDIPQKFVLQILSVIFYKETTLLGGYENIADHKKNLGFKNRKWQSAYLIKKELTNIFDFEKLRDEFDALLGTSYTEKLLNITDYLKTAPCWLKFCDVDKSENIVSLGKDILLSEFQLSSKDEFVTIPACKHKKSAGVIYEILKNHGNPMHISEMFTEYMKICPEREYTHHEQIRFMIQKHKEIVPIKRSSMYALKEWTHVKTGTIRDTIVDFLEGQDNPQSDRQIANYVMRHYPESNLTSIRTTMFNETLNRFSYFEHKLFGLKKKKYSPEFVLLPNGNIQLKTFYQHISDLEKFIAENGRLPFAPAKKRDELSLHIWWRKAVTGMLTLTEAQIAEIDRLKTKYADCISSKHVYDWNIAFDKFKKFLLEHNRMPSYMGTEKLLYSWWYKVKKDFANETLNEEQHGKYLELIEVIERIKK